VDLLIKFYENNKNTPFPQNFLKGSESSYASNDEECIVKIAPSIYKNYSTREEMDNGMKFKGDGETIRFVLLKQLEREFPQFKRE
jgi:hypothetical protein